MRKEWRAKTRGRSIMMLLDWMMKDDYSKLKEWKT